MPIQNREEGSTSPSVAVEVLKDLKFTDAFGSRPDMAEVSNVAIAGRVPLQVCIRTRAA
jgi:hypothetical protein